MNLVERLENAIEGNVLTESIAIESFARDESIFVSQPKIVVQPKNTQDLICIAEITKEANAHITLRGAGSGVTGAALGDHVVIDFQKFMNNVLEVNDEKAWVQPGVFLGELNDQLKPYQKIFGPDPGSKRYATMGGVVGNNAAGAHALVYGMTRDHVIKINCVLEDGRSLSTDDMPNDFDELVYALCAQANTLSNPIRQTAKNSSGWNVESLLKAPPNFAGLMTGSEGQLALFDSICVGLVDIPEQVTFSVLGFDSKQEAARALPEILATQPACVELIDDVIAQALCHHDASFADSLGLHPSGAYLWIEHQNTQTCLEHALFQTKSADEIERVWAFRSMASKVLHAQAKSRQPLRCIEDACVPVDQLAGFMDEVQDLLSEHDAEGAIFGHIGSGHLHINPWIDVTKEDVVGRVEKLMQAFYPIVWKHQGTISGEHGDGYLRREFASRQWSDRLELFQMVKDAFDPDHRLGFAQNMKNRYADCMELK